MAGTEQGVTSPEATFSACFGQPFLRPTSNPLCTNAFGKNRPPQGKCMAH